MRAALAGAWSAESMRAALGAFVAASSGSGPRDLLFKTSFQAPYVPDYVVAGGASRAWVFATYAASSSPSRPFQASLPAPLASSSCSSRSESSSSSPAARMVAASSVTGAHATGGVAAAALTASAGRAVTAARTRSVAPACGSATAALCVPRWRLLETALTPCVGGTGICGSRPAARANGGGALMVGAAAAAAAAMAAPLLRRMQSFLLRGSSLPRAVHRRGLLPPLLQGGLRARAPRLAGGCRSLGRRMVASLQSSPSGSRISSDRERARLQRL
jgi:hypothetical protein